MVTFKAYYSDVHVFHVSIKHTQYVFKSLSNPVLLFCIFHGVQCQLKSGPSWVPHPGKGEYPDLGHSWDPVTASTIRLASSHYRLRNSACMAVPGLSGYLMAGIIRQIIEIR